MKRKKILVPLLALTLALVLLLVGCFPSTNTQSGGTTTESRLSTLETKVVALAAQADTTDRQVETLKREVTAVSAPNLSSYATDAELQAALDNFITSLTPAQLAILKEKLGLSGGSNGSSKVDPDDAVKCDAQYNSTYTFSEASLPADGTIQIDIPIKLELTNELLVDIEDIMLSAEIRLYPESAISKLVVSGDVLIGDIDWQHGWALNWGYFESWGQEKIDADDSESYLLYYRPTLENTGADIPSLKGYTITVTMRFQCTDYDAAK